MAGFLCVYPDRLPPRLATEISSSASRTSVSKQYFFRSFQCLHSRLSIRIDRNHLQTQVSRFLDNIYVYLSESRPCLPLASSKRLSFHGDLSTTLNLMSGPLPNILITDSVCDSNRMCRGVRSRGLILKQRKAWVPYRSGCFVSQPLQLL